MGEVEAFIRILEDKIEKEKVRVPIYLDLIHELEEMDYDFAQYLGMDSALDKAYYTLHPDQE